MRDVHRWFSTETPIHTFSGQSRFGASSAARSLRFVSTWNLCQLAAVITSKTDRMNETSTSWDGKT